MTKDCFAIFNFGNILTFGTYAHHELVQILVIKSVLWDYSKFRCEKNLHSNELHENQRICGRSVERNSYSWVVLKLKFYYLPITTIRVTHFTSWTDLLAFFMDYVH